MSRKPRKQHVYEVTIRQYHDACVLVAALSPSEARRKAARRLDGGDLVFEFTREEVMEDWPVQDRGEDGP